MIIDCRTKAWQDALRADPYHDQRKLVYVDGVLIPGVFYLDTDAGFVRTYAVIEDGDPIATRSLSKQDFERGLREGWDMSIDGVVSKTIRGVVTLADYPKP